MDNLERQNRDDVQARLVRATAGCSNAYAKGKRSFAVFAKLNPEALKPLPSFARVEDTLRKQL